MSGPEVASPGWYPDPAGSGGQRYWDGAQWRFDEAPLAEEPMAADPGAGNRVSGPQPFARPPLRRPERVGMVLRRWWPAGAAVVVALLVGLGFALVGGGEGEDVTVAGPPSSASRPTGGTAPRATSTSSSAAPTTTAGATTTSPPVVSPPPAPTAPLPSFGAGVKLVNRDIAPGRYLSPSGPGCSWSRLSDLAGEYGSFLGRSQGGSGQVVVDILPTDYAFESEGCGQFVRYSPPPSRLVTFGDGTWVVSQQIDPGRYESTGAGTCSWQRLANFTGTGATYNAPGSAIAEADVDGSVVVDILPTDVGFSTSGCGTWVRRG